ncbi:hypothetical protein [Aeromonas sp. Marseille-Q7275]
MATPTSATPTIAIGNTPPEISNLTPSVNGGDVVVDEDDLADGSDSKESLTQAGITHQLAGWGGLADA